MLVEERECDPAAGDWNEGCRAEAECRRENLDQGWLSTPGNPCTHSVLLRGWVR